MLRVRPSFAPSTTLALFGGLTAFLLGSLLALLPLTSALLLIGAGVAAFLLMMTPLTAFVALLVLAPMRTLIATEAPWPLPLDIGQIGVIVLAGCWLVYRVIHRQPLLRPRWTPVYLALGLLILVTGVTLVNAVAPGAWLREWLKWWVMLIMVALVLDSGPGWRYLVLGLVAAGCANALVGLYIFFGGSGADHLLILGDQFRAFGTFGQPNPFGGFLGLLAPLALMSAYGHAHRLWHIRLSEKRWHGPTLAWLSLYGAAFALMTAAIIASWSRGAWLAFVISLAVMAFALPRRLWQSLLLAGSVGALVAGLWFGGWLPAAIVDRVSSAWADFFAFEDMRGVDITSANYAVVERLAHWQAALNMATDAPWLGVGLGHYEIVYDAYRLINWQEALGHAHNYYLNILAEAGILGLLGYLTAWAYLVWLTWRTRAHPDPIARALSVALLGSWAYLAAHSLIDNLYVNNLFIHLGVLLGLLALTHQQVWESTSLGKA